MTKSKFSPNQVDLLCNFFTGMIWSLLAFGYSGQTAISHTGRCMTSQHVYFLWMMLYISTFVGLQICYNYCVPGTIVAQQDLLWHYFLNNIRISFVFVNQNPNWNLRMFKGWQHIVSTTEIKLFDNKRGQNSQCVFISMQENMHNKNRLWKKLL